MAPSPKSFQQVLQELWELLKNYAQQETVGPLKNLGRQIGFGLAGSLAVALGVFLLVLGVMRGLQTHVQFFIDHNWVTYVVAVVLLGFVCYLCYRKAKGSSATAIAAYEPHTYADLAGDTTQGTGS